MYNRRFPFHHTPASGKRLDFIRIMIAIIAEKPSVGQDIARVVGATEKKDGYIVGNGYMVTWALGHLVTLADLVNNVSAMALAGIKLDNK